MTIQIYEIEKPNGKFVLYTDHLDAIIKVNEKAVKQHREAMAEKDAEITALKERVRELLQRIVDLENDANEFPTIAEFSNLQDDKEALELRNRTLTDAVSAHIKVCRGWFGDDHVWEQIIAHNEWEGKG